MTTAEFDHWTKHTDRSRNMWQRDEVTLHNQGIFLLYRGGENGLWVEVNRATVRIGNYEGAVPHIGEAIFQVEHTKTFETESKAFEAVANATGFYGLLALIGAL